jgi:hypothetical protein
MDAPNTVKMGKKTTGKREGERSREEPDCPALLTRDRHPTDYPATGEEVTRGSPIVTHYFSFR